jgi:hypothetical protein
VTHLHAHPYSQLHLALLPLLGVLALVGIGWALGRLRARFGESEDDRRNREFRERVERLRGTGPFAGRGREE